MFGKKRKIVTRMAPSPTGHLHIGTARTALYNFLYAKNKGGSFIMRSEDTDKTRSTKEFEKEIKDGLHWLGITWDEYYNQSERTEIYKKYLKNAINSDKAYISKEESRKKPGTEIEIIRLRNPNKKITFEDEIRGEITFDTTELDDFIIARSIDDVLYHFAVVVDDEEMNVTHVIRGEDHISNTPRQILIQEALGFERPIYAHLPLLLAPNKSKLSKRSDITVELKEYTKQGFLPEAIINYLSLLGWNPGTNQEIFTMEELIHDFDLSGVQKGGAIFSIEKLRWFNKEHMNKHYTDDMLKTIEHRLPESIKSMSQYSENRLQKLAPTITERISVLSDITDEAKRGEYDFAFNTPTQNLNTLKWKKDKSVRDALPRLQKIAEILSTIPEESTIEGIKNSIWDYVETEGRGEVLWPLRVALTAKEKSPDPFTVIYIIGTAEAYKRVQSACDTILKA